MHIGSDGLQQRQRPRGSVQQQTKTPTVRKSNTVDPSKILRTVYMPNEQTAAMAKTIANLEKQLEAQQQLSEERIQVSCSS